MFDASFIILCKMKMIKVNSIYDACNYYYLLSTAGITAFPKKMAGQISEKYKHYFKEFEKIFQKGLDPNIKDYEFNDQIKIDFSDLPEHYSPENLEQLYKDLYGSYILPLKFSFKQKSNFRGKFYPNLPLIEIAHIYSPESIYMLDRETVAEHELIHLIQILLGTEHSYNFNYNAGTPSKKIIKSPEEIIEERGIRGRKTIKDIEYWLDPAEFYAHLNDAKDRFMEKRPGKFFNKKTFKRFVGLISDPEGEDKFFRMLRLNNQQLWHKAISELWKQVETTLYWED